MAYILIILGLALAVTGGFMLLKKSNTVEEKTNSTSFDENKAKGDAFESYIVKQFDKKYFSLQEWRGDKYVDGVYPVSNHFPDLEVAFNWKEAKDHFAIECKWRNDYYQGAIEWAKGYQLKNYQEYAQQTKLPVYVVLGVGGTPAKPNELFVLPLAEIKYEKLFKNTLEPYAKEIGSTFFWDAQKKELR